MDYKSEKILKKIMVNNTVVNFYKSRSKYKKYVAVVFSNGKKVGTYHFGDLRFQHYKDNVSNEYADLNHYDEKRRQLYRARHKSDGKFPSSQWFAWHFLW